MKFLGVVVLGHVFGQHEVSRSSTIGHVLAEVENSTYVERPGAFLRRKKRGIIQINTGIDVIEVQRIPTHVQ